MSKTITEQIAYLEQENQSLRGLQKLFDKAVKMEFGSDTKELHKILKKSGKGYTYFEWKIAYYFGLKDDADFARFLTLFCDEDFINYYKRMKEKENE